MENKRISVIIPTYNAEKYIFDLLKILTEQTLQPDEIIIIDSESSDKTLEISNEFSLVKIINIKKKDFDHGGTRNLAIKNSINNLLVFLTQDALPKDNYFLENIINPFFEDNEIGIVYGRQVAKKNATVIEKFTRNFNYSANKIIKTKSDINKLGIKTFFCTNVCSAYRKDLLEQVGFFPEKIVMNEDMITGAKFIYKNYKICYNPLAAVYHSHNYTLIQQFNRYFDIGMSLKDNEQLFKNINSNNEGKKYTFALLNYLLKNNKKIFFYAVLEILFKFIAFKLGKKYNKLPNGLCKLLSMHK